jgi:hypothetical protein
MAVGENGRPVESKIKIENVKDRPNGLNNLNGINGHAVGHVPAKRATRAGPRKSWSAWTINNVLRYDDPNCN